MIPDRRLVVLAVLPVFPAVAFVLAPSVWPAIVGLDVVLLGVALGDALAARRAGAGVAVVREMGERQLVSRDFDVTLRVSGVRGEVELTDDPPAMLPIVSERLRVDGDEVAWSRSVCIDRRGKHHWGGVTARVRSPLGLWWRQRRLTVSGASFVRVGPDVTPLRGAALRGRRDVRRAQARQLRKVGGESEFERLRPYVSGDPWRHIDWKATARQRKLVVRQFGQEVGQNVVFLLDGGRLMTQRLGARTAFDVALDASLVLAWTALRQGDRVGMMVADRKVRTWVPPRAGTGQATRLVRAVTDVQPTLDEADAGAAFQWLSGRLRRRSLVVWLTRVLDEVAEERARAVVAAMAGRHLPVCVWLRDPRLDEWILGESDEEEGPWRRAAAADLALRRGRALEDLRRRGALVVDTTPDRLGDALRARYLEVKARHLL